MGASNNNYIHVYNKNIKKIKKIGGNWMRTSDNVIARLIIYRCAIGAQRNLLCAAGLRSSAVAIAIFKNSYTGTSHSVRGRSVGTQ